MIDDRVSKLPAKTSSSILCIIDRQHRTQPSWSFLLDLEGKSDVDENIFTLLCPPFFLFGQER